MRLSAADRAKAITTMRPGDSIAAAHRPRIDPALAERVVFIPGRVVNGLNVRQHWTAQAKRARTDRARALAYLTPGSVPPLPVVVTLTRTGPKAMDGDGLSASLKNTRDGVADAYGIQDNDPRISFVCEQEKCRTYGVRVMIRPAHEPLHTPLHEPVHEPVRKRTGE